MKAGKGMSSDFMLEIGSGSLARLMSEWAHNKSWAETQSDENESLRRQLAVLRRGLQQLVGAPEVPALPDAELMIALGHALEKVDGDAPVERQVVGYGKPGGAPSLVVSMPVQPGYDGPADPWEVRPPGESPWLAPGTTVVPPGQSAAIVAAEQVTLLGREQERRQAEQLERERQYGPEIVRCAEPVGSGFCGVQIIDGHCSEHGEVGPPTETMPPVEEPPAVPDGYVLGRVFTRGDIIPDDTTALPRLLTNRLGDVWCYSGSPDPGYPETAAFFCEAMHVENTLGGLLHMHGTLWELLNAPSKAEQAGEQVSGE